MDSLEGKSILERKTEELRAFREELKKRNLEGDKSVIDAIVERGRKLGINFNFQSSESSEEAVQKNKDDSAKKETVKLEIGQKKEGDVKKSAKRKKRNGRLFEDEESQIRRKLQELMREEARM